MKKQISCFIAKCGNCKKPFERPSLGSYSYGECLFNTIDGKYYVLASAFDSFPEKVKKLIPGNRSGMFWPVLAHLADPIQQLNLTSKIVCPHCNSTNIEVIEGERTGESVVNEVSFLNSTKLSSQELSNLVFTILENA